MLKRSGFTLLEFLVVLACIAIVAAIFFPVFAPHHERSYHSACLSNVKQLGLSAMQYTQDYDERFPNSGFTPVKFKGDLLPSLTYRAEKPPNVWCDQIWPYTKNSQMYYCPSDESKERRAYPNYSTPAQVGKFASSYTMNKWTAVGLEAAAVKKLGQFILLAERNNVAQAADGSYLFAPWKWSKDPSGPQISQDLTLTRHKGSSNSNPYEGSIVGFADGHAKWLTPERITEMQDSGSFHP